MHIKFNVSGVKAGSFENDEKKVIDYGYVYAIGDFRDNINDGNFQTGLQIQKFRCTNKVALNAIRNILVKANGPVEIVVDIDFTAKEGEISRPVILAVVG